MPYAQRTNVIRGRTPGLGPGVQTVNTNAPRYYVVGMPGPAHVPEVWVVCGWHYDVIFACATNEADALATAAALDLIP